jgi:hypothetical protein
MKNSFETALADETTITTANSSTGSAGNALTVTLGSVATAKFDTATAMHGSLSCRHNIGATPTSVCQMDWTFTAVAHIWARFYINFSTLAVRRFFKVVQAGQILELRTTAAGAIELRNTLQTVVATGTALTANTWYRVEVDAIPGSPVTNTVTVFLGDATGTALQTISGSSNFAAVADITGVTFGNSTASVSFADYWFDDVAVTDVGALGPEVTATTVGTSLQVNQAAIHRASNW